MACFEIKDLTFYYPAAPEKAALDNINLTINQGEYITVCGKSGSGKTTLLKHFKTVLTPAGQRTGSILLDGVPLEDVDLRTQSSQVGYVMQNPDSQIVTDKVWHELAFGLENLGVDQNIIRLRVAEMASYFGIQNWFHREVSELSGGQKQLLNLAAIMAMHPSVIILDEPTSQLDPIAAADFLNTVRKINLELGTTIIITEHRLEDILHASDRVIVMDKGRVLGVDTPLNIGKVLYENKNPMFSAMPAPVQVYYNSPDACREASEGKCPLTVREGRTWLTKVFEGKEPQQTLPDEPSPDSSAENALEIKDLYFRYTRETPDVLKGTTLAVPKGTVYAVVGGNGTGKSTMLRSICRILTPYRGSVKIFGRKTDKYTSAELFKNNLAMLPQDPQSLFAKTTVAEDLAEMLGPEISARIEKDIETKGFENTELAPEILDVAALCQITDLLKSHPADLSGGEQQRAALAKVLLTNPRLLLLDEPTKGMDSIFKLSFAQILSDLKARGTTIVMVSHDVEFCARYADMVGMFFDGNIIASDTPRRFFSRNSFYTTAANRMGRHIFPDAVTADDLIYLLK
ncbi:MAG: ATP-binding cassette domain-containing protein [Lachnospiraceae bacterium]|nr:ATP-binding cassette domain-containing protein [Lachnospiraceae bacterium]